MTDIADKAVDRLRTHRAALESRLSDRPNVLGFMIGTKIKGGRILGGPVLTCLVSEKLPIEALGTRERIPRRLTVQGQAFTTDVISFDGLVRQADPFPSGPPLTTSDGTEDATLSAFARSRHGVFGLTCAHALEGSDNDPYTQGPVAVWSPSRRQRLLVGRSALAVTGGGSGLPGSFGFADAALFTLEEPYLRGRAQSGSALSIRTGRLRERVRGVATTGVKTGQVVGVDLAVGRDLVDIVVQVDPPGTFVGDSGTLWYGADGDAIAIHAKASREAPGEGSRLSACMNIERAAASLHIELVDV